MHLFRAALIGAFLTLGLVGSVRAESLSPEAKLKRDQSDCRRWAILHTGFDPKNTTPSEAPHPEQTLLAPHPAAVGGSRGLAASALRDSEQRRNAIMERKQRAQDDADLEARRAVYERALRTCLEGRNHTVKDRSLR